MLRYQYRKLFKLSAQEMEDEPSHEFFTNLLIHGYIQTRKTIDAKPKKT